MLLPFSFPLNFAPPNPILNRRASIRETDKMTMTTMQNVFILMGESEILKTAERVEDKIAYEMKGTRSSEIRIPKRDE